MWGTAFVLAGGSELPAVLGSFGVEAAGSKFPVAKTRRNDAGRGAARAAEAGWMTGQRRHEERGAAEPRRDAQATGRPAAGGVSGLAASAPYSARFVQRSALESGRGALVGSLPHLVGVPRLSGPSPSRLVQAKETDEHDKGSGKHGSWEPSSGDRSKKTFWYGVASMADKLGLGDAARHMRHYLDNTGAELTVSVDRMLLELPGLARRYELERQRAREEASRRVGAGERSFRLVGTKRGYYATKGESRNWYFAMGGLKYWYEAKGTVLPAPSADRQASLVLHVSLHVCDRYNWDGGKSVDIGPIHVTDESLGRLHKVGLAREFHVKGSSSPEELTLDMRDVEVTRYMVLLRERYGYKLWRKGEWVYKKDAGGAESAWSIEQFLVDAKKLVAEKKTKKKPQTAPEPENPREQREEKSDDSLKERLQSPRLGGKGRKRRESPRPKLHRE